jgi:hypothetical protein
VEALKVTMGYPLETDRPIGVNAGKESIVREFSTFCIPQNCQGYRVPQWVSDRTLHRLLIYLVDHSLRATKDAWARYFLLTAQQHDRLLNLTISDLPECRLERWIDRLIEVAPEANQGMRVIHHQFIARQDETGVIAFLREPIAAQKFLSAYLQSPCWYAARHFHSTKIAPSQLSYQYSLEDCFQIATEQTIQPVKILKHFQFERPNITLRTYAEKTLERVLQRSIQLKTIQNGSTWKLLRYLSQKELIVSLQAEGYSHSNLTSHTLIWRCFKEIYHTKQVKQNQLAPPTNQQIQAMGDRYNQRCKLYEIIEPIAVEIIPTWLETIARSVRAYRSSDAVLDRLWQDHQPSDGLADLMRQEQITQVGAIVRQAVEDLPVRCFADTARAAQITLNLWFGLELTHAEILQLLKSRLGIEKQYQLSRQIKRYKKLILVSILNQLNEQDFEVKANTMDCLLEALDEYLANYCKSYFYSFLQNHLQQLQSHEKLILYLHYQQHWEDKKIAEKFNLKSSISSRVVTLNLSFQSCLKNAIQTNWGLDLSHCDARLTNFVEIWLKESATLDMGDVNHVKP